MANRINVKLILELKSGGMSQNEIARSRHMSRSSISSVVNIAKEKNIVEESGAFVRGASYYGGGESHDQ